MDSITTTSSNSPSQRNSTSTSNVNPTSSTELLLIASALNGSYDKSPDSTTSESYIAPNSRKPSTPQSCSRANSGESSESTHLQYNSNLEAEEVSVSSNFLKMSPQSCPSGSGKTKEPNDRADAGTDSQNEREDQRTDNTEEEQPKNRNVLVRTPAEDENEGDVPSISESSQSQSHSHSQPFTDSNFHTPSSSLHNLAAHLEPEFISQEKEKQPSPNEPPIESQTEGLCTPANTEINGNRLDPSEEIGIFIESPSISNSTEQSYESENNHKNLNASPSSLSVSIDSNHSTASRDEDFVTPTSSNDNSSTKDQLLQPGSYNTKPTKKKMWYHVFTPSYKSRVGDFKKNFKDLPSEERLIVDYSCAIQKDILVQGRMYVSQNYICFHANIFGWETQTLIKFKEILSITKEKTALVIPNAIQVSTENEKYFFTSFVTRDSAYLMLFKLWQSSLLDQGLSPKEIWKLVRASYGEELGIASDAETEDFIIHGPSPLNSLVKAASISTLISSTSEADDSRSMQIDMVCASEDSRKVSTESNYQEKNEIITNGIRRRIDLSQLSIDSSESEAELELRGTDKLILEIPRCPLDHLALGKELVNTIIPCDIDTLFTMLFTASTFFLDFHSSRKTFDIVQSDWEENPDDNLKTRKVSFTVTLTQVMGPKHSQLTETQVMLPESRPGRLYAIDIEAVNSGIPYADTFYVTTHYCLSRISSQQSNLVIVCQIKYRKSIWGVTKSFIERNSWAGLSEFYGHLERALKEECTKSNLSPPVSPRGPSAGPIRRPRKKYPAPAIPGDIAAVAKIRTGSLGRNVTAPAASAADLETPLLQDGSYLVKIILTILAGLLILNAFLYVKLAQLETSTTGPSIFQVPRFTLPENEMPQTHQEWLGLLQQQESLHRMELQKWHGILLSALEILKQAEDDLQSLKLHVATYNEEYGKNLKSHPMFQQKQNSDSETPNTENLKSVEL